MSTQRADFCGECFDDFRYDDIGGYNPPCACRYKCRDCCDADCERRTDEYERPEDSYPDDQTPSVAP